MRFVGIEGVDVVLPRCVLPIQYRAVGLTTIPRTASFLNLCADVSFNPYQTASRPRRVLSRVMSFYFQFRTTSYGRVYLVRFGALGSGASTHSFHLFKMFSGKGKPSSDSS